MRPPTRTTVEEAATAWVEGVHKGTISTRSGLPYKPSAVRSYVASLRTRVLPAFGSNRLSDLRAMDVQDFIDGLKAEGLDASTIRNTLMPLRAIYRRALVRGEVAVNPTSGLELPAVQGRRDRTAAPGEAALLIAALAPEERALWATAFYAGLRRGELMALRWENVDLAQGTIAVTQSWDEREGPIEPKSRAGRRSVPLPGVLRDALTEHKLVVDRASGLVFGVSESKPFTPSNIWRRARAAWRLADLAPIGLHESRHTYASLMIAAGVNAKALTTYMGHASVAITYDRYGHLMPGNEAEAAALLDAYLIRADSAARIAAVSTDF
jgi:integrase